MIDKSELETGMLVRIEISHPNSFETKEIDLEIEWVDKMFEKPLEFTANDGCENNLYRIYLDKNKISLVNDKNGDFIGCIGNIRNIHEI